MLASIIIRFFLVPLFSYYNIITVFFHKAKDKTLRIVNYVSIIFTVFTIFAIIACSIFISIYQSEYRFKSLEYQPPNNNITTVNEKKITHPICAYQVFNISAFDAFGFALGGYDIKHNETIFDNQMKIFFGENYSSHITYTVYELDKYFLFLKYYDSLTNTHVFAFRGFNSGPEIAFQLELFAAEYVIPFFEDNVPFLSFINENWLSFYTDFLNAFGLRFFSNGNLIVKYVNSIRKIYDQLNISQNENVLFTGINCGGVIAKISGTLLYQRSISFISFPIELDFLQNWFHYSLSDASLVTNVFNVESFFSVPDTQYANNIGIDTPAYQKSKYCTSDFCEMFSKLDNVYKTFCSMSEICGKGNQFDYYCQKTIGEKYVRIIRENLKR
ncbi:hypothetical protein M9Y10_016141 [Tritrichomonas musculus]|uniref:Fungal lipase-like domain-containing protein n=1 Tax=Tritrichomonas musculus TaxID=1915356 RepID=A0ABR2I6T3_9EUKA